MQRGIKGLLSVRLVRWSDGVEVWRDSESFSVPCLESKEVWSKSIDSELLCDGRKREEHVMLFEAEVPELEHGRLSNYHLLAPLKASTLPHTKLECEASGDGSSVIVSVRSSQVAAFVWLQSGDIVGRFSDNGFGVVLPNEPRQVEFIPFEPFSLAHFRTVLSATSLRDTYE